MGIEIMIRLISFLILLLPSVVFADITNLDAIKVTPMSDGGQQYSLSLQVLAVMTMLTLLPAIILMTTSFTRIIIVLSILRQALGMAQTPGNQIIIGISLFLTIFIMTPIFTQIYDDAIQPYNEKKITQTQAIENGILPIKKFMLDQTRSEDLGLFGQLSNIELPKDADPAQISLPVLISAFVTSELKTAFQIGFIIFIPFIIIDLVVASVLMSMGMMMLSPLIISLPFKIMLFVLVDGWTLIIGTLANSFLMS